MRLTRLCRGRDALSAVRAQVGDAELLVLLRGPLHVLHAQPRVRGRVLRDGRHVRVRQRIPAVNARPLLMANTLVLMLASMRGPHLTARTLVDVLTLQRADRFSDSGWNERRQAKLGCKCKRRRRRWCSVELAGPIRHLMTRVHGSSSAASRSMRTKRSFQVCFLVSSAESPMSKLIVLCSCSRIVTSTPFVPASEQSQWTLRGA